MATSTIKVPVSADIETVWKIVTAVENYTWRSDLSRTEILSENKFIEYTKDGFATTFTVTAKEPCKRWEFDMDNENMQGHWVGTFTEKGKETALVFTEEVTAKKHFMKPFVKTYLKRQQARFVTDLKQALQEIKSGEKHD